MAQSVLSCSNWANVLVICNPSAMDQYSKFADVVDVMAVDFYNLTQAIHLIELDRND